LCFFLDSNGAAELYADPLFNFCRTSGGFSSSQVYFIFLPNASRKSPEIENRSISCALAEFAVDALIFYRSFPSVIIRVFSFIPFFPSSKVPLQIPP